MTGHVLTRTSQPGNGQQRGRRRWAPWTVWAAVWVPGLLVALGAAVATAHGLYQVAAAAGAPEPIAWLYPLITDGLALVAYASTARLTGHGRGYAWTVVVLAAGLSGLAQASHLAGGVASASPLLRFGVGAWPAIAAAIVAHLLFLLGTDARPDAQAHRPPGQSVVPPQPSYTAVRPSLNGAVQPVEQAEVEHPGLFNDQSSAPADVQPDSGATGTVEHPAAGRDASPARERAVSAARRYAARHGALPTVSALMALAEVSRGTASTALQELRQQPTRLHAVHDNDDSRSHQ